MDSNTAELIQEAFGNRAGFCVEAGAYDGVLESTTLELEGLGWTCLCIEPNPQVFQELIKNRALCLEYALAPANEDNVPFEIYYNGRHEASFSAFQIDKAFKDAFSGQYTRFEKREVLVSVRTLDFCLEEAGFPRLDILSLDVEGWEMEVLKGFSMERWKPQVLIIENIFKEDGIRHYLSNLGYRYTGKRHQHNDLFVRDEA